MNAILFLSTTNLLLSRGVLGLFWSVFLFALCFACIHIAKLARLGALYRKSTSQKPPEPPNPPEKEKEKAPASAQEPVYYIVERKKKRAKPQYGEPKEIRFK